MAIRGRGRRHPLARALTTRRLVALLVLAFVAFLYYRPLAAYVEARAALEHRRAEVAALTAERRALERRLQATAGTGALVREARALGYVRPGEQLFIVKGIERWRRERAQEGPRRAARLARDG
ncbi:MAG: septum formation initiator family protein [Thermoleophilia bacterium]|nr:septum formation initiator family protein [Thermoleophilia bacterium]